MSKDIRIKKGLNINLVGKNITGPLEMNSTWFNVPNELENLVVSSSYWFH